MTPAPIRWARRLHVPALLLALATLLALAAPPLLRAFALERSRTALWLGEHIPVILAVLAVGWMIATVGEALIARRLARLELDREDNLHARKLATQLDVVRRIFVVVVAVVTVAAALTTVPGVRQIGVSLFASAGIAGLAIGLAARPVLSNLISGLQIAFTQPIRIDDVVIVEGEWGWVEEVGLFYVVVKLWDWRRLVVPLTHFTEKPFQNWTRESAHIIGAVTWSLDARAPVAAMRLKLTHIVEATELWSGEVVNLQVTDATGPTLTVRALASARTSPRAWDLRCHIREEMLLWLQAEHPEALPLQRVRVEERQEALELSTRAHVTGPPPLTPKRS